MRVNRSASGKATLTENGGGSTNTGGATCIAGQDGQAVKPMFIPKGYSNSDHAVFIIQPGMVVAEASHDRNGEDAMVRRIVSITPDGVVTLSEPVYEYSNGDGVGDENFKAVAMAALAKSKCYHCREPHYIAA